MRAILAAILITLASPAVAQAPARCGPADEVRKIVAQYGEVPVFAGVGSDGSVVTVFLNASTGSWSALSFPAAADGAVACLAASGERGRVAVPGVDG
jgi:hypothetical protein